MSDDGWTLVAGKIETPGRDPIVVELTSDNWEEPPDRIVCVDCGTAWREGDIGACGNCGCRRFNVRTTYQSDCGSVTLVLPTAELTRDTGGGVSLAELAEWLEEDTTE